MEIPPVTSSSSSDKSRTKAPSLEPNTSDTMFVSTSSTAASASNPMPFRVWSGDRRSKKSLVARTCTDVMVKAAAKMEIPDVRKCRLVLEQCGTEVDDDDYLGMLPSNSVLMLLQPGEKWLPVHSSTQLISNLADDTLTLNLGLSPTSASTVPKVGFKPSPLPLKPRIFSKSPENSRSPSGSREGSLPLPSPSAFANIKTYAIESCLPTAFSVQGCSSSSFSTPAPLTPISASSHSSLSPAHLHFQTKNLEGEINAGSEQQQNQQPPIIPTTQQRPENNPPTRLSVKACSMDSGVSSTGLAQNIVNGVVSYGTASNGMGLTPIVISGSAMSGILGGEVSPTTADYNVADNCPIYALGPLGPFFVASGSSGFVAGNSTGSIVREELVASTNSAVLGTGRIQGAGAHVDSDVIHGSGVVDPITVGASTVGRDTDDAVEIVAPPTITSPEQMAKLQKASDERFKRKSKNLPCTVAGCQKVFRDEYDRKTHLRCHTGERPFKCFSCDKRFAHVSSRIHHHKTLHLKKREFVCSVCGKSFVKRIEAQRHQWTAHRIPSAPSQRNEGTADFSAVDSTTSDSK